MSKPKFTPGPWEISRYTNYIGYSISAPGAGCIAERWYASEREDAPIEANAHLIAAAPEMYEALGAMIADDAFAELCAVIGEEPNWIKTARAAIAKAEGNQ